VAHDVFISYSHHDKPAADAVCATLEADGIRCWIAPRDVVPGQDWGEAIVDAIRSSRVMVLVFSQHANASPQIKREVERAVNAETVLIPFRIEDVAPERGLEYFLGTPHWLDAMTPPLESHLERLATAVKTFVGSRPSAGTGSENIPRTDVERAKSGGSADRAAPPVPASGQADHSGPSVPTRPWWRRRSALAAASAIVLLIIAVSVVAVVSTARKEPSNNKLSEPKVTELPITGLTDPVGVAVDRAGNIYVTDFASKRVLKLAGGSGPQTELAFTGLSNPNGVAVDDAGNVYVTDCNNNRVLELPGGSGPQIELPFAGLNYPAGIALDDAGDIFVVDVGNNRVLKLTAGKGPQDELPFTGLDWPSWIALTSRGDVYVSDERHSRVLMLSRGRAPQIELPFTGLHKPTGVAVDDSGNVYVADGVGTYDNSNSLPSRMLILRGGTAPQRDLPIAGLNRPIGLAVDGAGNVYIADNHNHRVLKLSAG
jgi:DNA-binding beta-propeller fold protein YncE